MKRLKYGLLAGLVCGVLVPTPSLASSSETMRYMLNPHLEEPNVRPMNAETRDFVMQVEANENFYKGDGGSRPELLTCLPRYWASSVVPAKYYRYIGAPMNLCKF